jgi:hypothetical protein
MPVFRNVLTTELWRKLTCVNARTLGKPGLRHKFVFGEIQIG